MSFCVSVVIAPLASKASAAKKTSMTALATNVRTEPNAWIWWWAIGAPVLLATQVRTYLSIFTQYALIYQLFINFYTIRTYLSIVSALRAKKLYLLSILLQQLHFVLSSYGYYYSMRYFF